MRVDIKKNEENTEVRVYGRLDTVSSPMLEEDLQKIIKGGERNLVIDLKNTEYVASSGLRVFLAALKEITKLNGSMVITNVSDNVMEIFEITGFSDILNFR